MKKLLCIALFSIAIMANATEKKEIVANNSKEVAVENSDVSSEINFEKNISEDVVFQSCGDQGNVLYDNLTSGPNPMSHRDARRERRTFVRECRDHIWPFPWA